MERTKRIFISDIHMGDTRSMGDPNHYGWFKKNIPVLEHFLDVQLQATDVKEVVILGDLFDTWVIPTDKAPLTNFDDICSNPNNKPVIDKLKALAGNSDIKLAYVPGNHDMGMNVAGISATEQFMDTTFPGIRFFCKSTVPWGVYTVGTLVAEHGNHYCLFNAPDIWTSNDTFFPLGYFISRIVAYKVLKTGYDQDSREIFFKFLKEFMMHPDFIKDMFYAIVEDAGLHPYDSIDVTGVPGYTGAITVEMVGNRFSNLIHNWKKTPGNINVPTAIYNDLGNLYFAAHSAYLEPYNSNTNIVIFGHTHIPTMDKQYDTKQLLDKNPPTSDAPYQYIYANSGTWVDQCKYGCTYVETEEVQDKKRHYVRVKKSPDNTCIDEGFVEM